MSAFEDSITSLIQELCQFHISDKRRAFLTQPVKSKFTIQNQLKKKAYDTIFGYLNGPVKYATLYDRMII